MTPAGSARWDLYLGTARSTSTLFTSGRKRHTRQYERDDTHGQAVVSYPDPYNGSSKAARIKVYINGKPSEIDITHDKLTGPSKPISRWWWATEIERAVQGNDRRSPRVQSRAHAG